MNIHTLQKLRNALLATLAVLTLSLAGVYIYARFFEQPDLTYKPLPFPMVFNTIYPGSVAAAIATRCNSRKTVLSYQTSRYLRRENSNQPVVILESVWISAEPGCQAVSTRANVVPIDTQPGFYRFGGVARVPGLIDYHDVGWNTDVFEVVARPVKDKP